MLLYVIFNVTYFFNGAISSSTLYCRLGTLFSSVQLSLLHYYLQQVIVFSWHNATTITTCLQVQILLLEEYEVGGSLVIRTSDKTSASYGPTLASSLHLFSSCSFDPSSAYHIKDVPMSLSGSSLSPKNDRPIKSKVGIKKRNLDVIRKF
jgi:hypothetical protein